MGRKEGGGKHVSHPWPPQRGLSFRGPPDNGTGLPFSWERDHVKGEPPALGGCVGLPTALQEVPRSVLLCLWWSSPLPTSPGLRGPHRSQKERRPQRRTLPPQDAVLSVSSLSPMPHLTHTQCPFLCPTTGRHPKGPGTHLSPVWSAVSTRKPREGLGMTETARFGGGSAGGLGLGPGRPANPCDLRKTGCPL